jgi:hypothetical protein
MSGSYTESELKCLCQVDEDRIENGKMTGKQIRFPWLELAACRQL